MTDKKQVYGNKPAINDVKVTKEKREMYENIFTLAEHEKKVYILIGNSVITKQTFKDMKTAKAFIDSKPWELIVNATCCIYDLAKQTPTNK